VTTAWAYSGDTQDGFKTQYQRVGQDADLVDGATLQPEARSWILPGLSAETEVKVRVVAYNALGESPPEEVSETTPPGNVETDLTQILVYENMSNVPIGESWNGHVPFGTSITIGSQEVTPLTSDRVGMNEMLQGSTGYGRWGFSYEQPFSAREGDEIWFRVFELMPIGYDHYAYGEGERLKWMRMNNLQIIGGANGGYNDVYFDRKNDQRFLNIKESSTDGKHWITFAGFDGSKLYADGNWHSYEMYVRFSKDTTLGEVRFWVDGQAAGKVSRATLVDPVVAGTEANGPYHCNRLLYHTWWNGGCPKTQRSYYDNVAIAMKIAGGRDDTPHLGTDETGFPYIGSKVQ
jgi:hypothetical protein